MNVKVNDKKNYRRDAVNNRAKLSGNNVQFFVF